MISNDAKTFLRNSKIEGVSPDRVFAYKIPGSINPETDNKIIFLFTDVNSSPDRYGSDTFHALSQRIQLQIFYPNNYAEDEEILEIKIHKYLESYGFRMAFSYGRHELPDSSRLESTIQYNREKIIN